MAILEGLGPTRKIFEELEPGDYLLEVSEPGEKGWLREFVDEDDEDCKATYVGWALKVILPEEASGRIHFFNTMVYASPEKIAKAKKAYDPAGFLYQFLSRIGAGEVKDGVVTIHDDYLTDGELDLDKLIGLRFWGSIRQEVIKSGRRKGEMATNLVKVWAED
jgi:hypothetical protein